MPSSNKSHRLIRVVSYVKFSGFLFAGVALMSAIDRVAVSQAAEHVVHVSIDGFGGPSLQGLIANNADTLPNLTRLQNEGAFTYNARTDYRYSITMPNHASMLTGLPVTRPLGRDETVYHGYTFNSDLETEGTIHSEGNPARDYIPSVFDVVHDSGTFDRTLCD